MVQRENAKRPVHHRRDRCRSCGAKSLDVFLELGPQPLANNFLSSPMQFEDELFFPLDLAFCRTCTLVQIVDVVDPEVLFSHYLYVSGTSQTMAKHFGAYADTVVGELGLGKADRVAEVASNDGTLLAHFLRLGTRVLGVEPAKNIAALANSYGIPTINRFFSSRIAEEIVAEQGPSAVACANNVLAHVDEPVDFLQGLRRLVEPAGTVVVEAPYLVDFLSHFEYDTVYHEHLSYFSVSALMGLYERAGLSLTRIDRVPVHGGSLRIWAKPAAAGSGHAASVRDMAGWERKEGYADLPLYQYFAEEVRKHRTKLRTLIKDLRAQGYSVAAYGAPAKGNTLLNYCGLGTDLIAFTVDKNPLKVGYYTPGVHLPVLPVVELLEKRPDYALILPWNMSEEIVKQEAAYRRSGGRFIVPIPEPRIVE